MELDSAHDLSPAHQPKLASVAETNLLANGMDMDRPKVHVSQTVCLAVMGWLQGEDLLVCLQNG